MVTPAKRLLQWNHFRSRFFASVTSPSQVSENNFKKQFPSYKFKYVAKLIMLLFADRKCDSSMEPNAIQMGSERWNMQVRGLLNQVFSEICKGRCCQIPADKCNVFLGRISNHLTHHSAKNPLWFYKLGFYARIIFCICIQQKLNCLRCSLLYNTNILEIKFLTWLANT